MSESGRPTVVITGGTRGLGLAAARRLGETGATVVLIGRDKVGRDKGRDEGRDEGGAERAAQTLQASGIDAHGYSCNVARGEEVDHLAERMAADLGAEAHCDILIASAGVMSEPMSKTLRTSEDHWRHVLGTNLDGVFNAIRVFGPGMAERRRGRVITLSACLGRFSGPGTSGGLAPYRVSKAAVNALTRNFAAEMQFGRRGVFADAVCPGHCRTDMGGMDAPRSAEQGADTIVWLATRELIEANGTPVPTGLLWEDRQIVPW